MITLERVHSCFCVQESHIFLFLNCSFPECTSGIKALADDFLAKEACRPTVRNYNPSNGLFFREISIYINFYQQLFCDLTYTPRSSPEWSSVHDGCHHTLGLAKQTHVYLPKNNYNACMLIYWLVSLGDRRCWQIPYTESCLPTCTILEPRAVKNVE